MALSEIARLDALEEAHVEQTARLLIESFYPMFQRISRDREILYRLFCPCLQRDSFYILLEGGRVAGFLAVSDHRKRAVVVEQKICVSEFGGMKGKILAWQLAKIMSVPAVTRPEQGYLDFLAVAPEYRRRGAADRLMEHVEEHTDFTELYLDVLVSNSPAVNLYQKRGYQTVQAKEGGFWRRLAGIEAMNVMKKTLRQ